MSDTVLYRKYVEGIYQIRKREMDSFMKHHVALINAFPKVRVGNCEGGMSASRYHNDVLDSKLARLIISAWSCEVNYYISCAQHAQICEDKCDKTLPQLKMIGDLDQYSVASEESNSVS